MLADLLKAVAAFAAGGRLALEKQSSAAARIAARADPLGERQMALGLKDIKAALTLLAETYPDCFTAEQYLPHRPLKIGIDRDLAECCPPSIAGNVVS